MNPQYLIILSMLLNGEVSQAASLIPDEAEYLYDEAGNIETDYKKMPQTVIWEHIKVIPVLPENMQFVDFGDKSYLVAFEEELELENGRRIVKQVIDVHDFGKENRPVSSSSHQHAIDIKKLFLQAESPCIEEQAEESKRIPFTIAVASSDGDIMSASLIPQEEKKSQVKTIWKQTVRLTDAKGHVHQLNLTKKSPKHIHLNDTEGSDLAEITTRKDSFDLIEEGAEPSESSMSMSKIGTSPMNRHNQLPIHVKDNNQSICKRCKCRHAFTAGTFLATIAMCILYFFIQDKSEAVFALIIAMSTMLMSCMSHFCSQMFSCCWDEEDEEESVLVDGKLSGANTIRGSRAQALSIHSMNHGISITAGYIVFKSLDLISDDEILENMSMFTSSDCSAICEGQAYNLYMLRNSSYADPPTALIWQSADNPNSYMIMRYPSGQSTDRLPYANIYRRMSV